jgi:release factor glutamine methyltransferase
MGHPVSVADLLVLARSRGLESGDAQALLAHHIGRGRAWLLAHDTDPLEEELVQSLVRLIGRRAAGEPVAYLTGVREFYGLSLIVNPAVLIPRPETELLVDLARELAPKGGKVLDLCTGSGCVAVALAHQRPDLNVHGSDLSEAALAVARSNAKRHGLAIQWRQGDLLVPWAAHKFDLIVGNPPYIGSQDPHLTRGDLRFEPAMALHDGADGRTLLQRIVATAHEHLATGAWLALEHGFDQSSWVQAQMLDHGFVQVSSRSDLAGHPRVTFGQRPWNTKLE